MAETKYRQCVLQRQLTSETATTSFIPEKFANVGEVLKLKDSNGNWTDGWVVKSAGQLVDEPPDFRKAIKSHRKRTGDSLPK